MSDNHPDLSVTEARQGRRGRHVLIILLVSLALVMVAFIAIYGLNVANFSGQGAQQAASPQDARTFDQPMEAAKQTETVPASQ